MKFRTLGKTGLSVSTLGFGASPFGNVFGAVDLAECQRAVDFAVDCGINFFDVSPYYGHTLAEQRLGQVLEAKRQDVLLATKCGRYGAQEFDFSRTRLLASIDESLLRLRTDYVDLLQAHDIEFVSAEQIVNEAIPALAEIKASGKARFIGITGYQLKMLASIAGTSPVDTVLSYCRANLLVDDLHASLLPTIQRNRLGLINASPLHMGLLAPGEPPSWHPAPESVKQVARRMVALCSERGVSLAQIGLRFCLDDPQVATTLVGMATTEQVRANVGAMSMASDEDLLAELRAIAAPVHNRIWASGLPENADELLSEP